MGDMRNWHFTSPIGVRVIASGTPRSPWALHRLLGDLKRSGFFGGLAASWAGERDPNLRSRPGQLNTVDFVGGRFTEKGVYLRSVVRRFGFGSGPIAHDSPDGSRRRFLSGLADL